MAKESGKSEKVENAKGGREIDSVEKREIKGWREKRDGKERNLRVERGMKREK